MRLELGNRIWDDGTQVRRKILKEEWSVQKKLRLAQEKKGFNLRMCHIIEGLLNWNWNLTTLILFCLNSIPRFASHTSCTAAAIKCFQEAISFNPLRDLERCNGTATKGNFIQRSSGWVTSISFVKKSRPCFHSTLLMMSVSRKKKKRDSYCYKYDYFLFQGLCRHMFWSIWLNFELSISSRCKKIERI